MSQKITIRELDIAITNVMVAIDENSEQLDDHKGYFLPSMTLGSSLGEAVANLGDDDRESDILVGLSQDTIFGFGGVVSLIGKYIGLQAEYFTQEIDAANETIDAMAFAITALAETCYKEGVNVDSIMQETERKVNEIGFVNASVVELGPDQAFIANDHGYTIVDAARPDSGNDGAEGSDPEPVRDGDVSLD